MQPKPPDIVVSNPARQYTPQLVAALYRVAPNIVFFTSFWFKKENKLHRVLRQLPVLKGALSKKSSTVFPANLARMHWTGMLFSFLGRFFFTGERRSFYADRIHDGQVSKYVRKVKPAIIVGYEKSCLESFREAKKYGAVTVLDLAQVHTLFIEDLRKTFPFFRKVTGSPNLFRNVQQVKLQEYERADFILVLSSFARQTLLANGVPEHKIRQVTLGFEPQLFLPKKHYQLSGEKPLRVVFCGTINYRKGVHLLVDFIRKNKQHRIELIFIGPPGDAVHLLKSAPNITYYDYLGHQQMVNVLHGCDFFVLPSFLDSWAMVVVEAMACGLPVIISENTGAKDVVFPGCGFVIPTGSAEALEEKIMYFYRNREVLETMGRRARRVVENNTWANYQCQINKIFSEIMQGGQVAVPSKAYENYHPI